MITLLQKPRGESYKYLMFMGMLYSTLLLLVIITNKKVIILPFFGFFPCTGLFIGLFYMLGDILAEVYGYRQAQKLVMLAFLMGLIFNFSMSAIAKIPNSNFVVSWASVQDPSAYEFLFGNAYLEAIIYTFSYFVSIYFNMRLLSRWKILLKGRYFWIRSISSSFIGFIIFTAIVNPLLAAAPLIEHKMTLIMLLKFMIFAVFVKIISLIILAYPGNFLCAILKKAEGVDVYDYGVNYNPFKKATT